MPLVAPPIDFNALRVAIVAAVAQVTGLTDNSIIMSEPEQPNAPRPPLPYVTLKFSSPLVAPKGMPAWNVDDQGTYSQRTQRSFTVSFNTYGPSHEAAYTLMATIQAGFDMMPVQQGLSAAGIAVWTLGAILDLSVLLNTGYEGRAQMDITYGVAANAQYSNTDVIQIVPVAVQPPGQDGIVTVNLGASNGSN